jgi:hypothetical protein
MIDSDLKHIEKYLVSVHAAIRLDEAETRQRIDFEVAGSNDDYETVAARHWARHKQRCASLKLQERRLLDELVKHHIHAPMKAIIVNMDGELVCVP